jgi:hypothetical protein
MRLALENQRLIARKRMPFDHRLRPFPVPELLILLWNDEDALTPRLPNARHDDQSAASHLLHTSDRPFDASPHPHGAARLSDEARDVVIDRHDHGHHGHATGGHHDHLDGADHLGGPTMCPVCVPTPACCRMTTISYQCRDADLNFRGV